MEKASKRINVYARRAEDGSIYWTAKYIGIDGVVGGGDTPEEAVADLKENYRVFIFMTQVT